METFADAALGDKSISTNHAERTNSSGEVLDDPDSQRVAVDSVTANELLSGNVQTVDATVEVGGYTFDFEQLVADKNGNGMLSYTISNPDGVKDWYESGYGEINFNWYSNPNGGLVNPTIYSESGEELDSRLLLRSDISTDTELHVVACFTGNLQENEGIRLDLIKAKDNDSYSDIKEIRITIDPAWYASGWAKLMYGILLIAIIYIIVIRAYSRRANQ